jgi:hyaluronan synthase
VVVPVYNEDLQVVLDCLRAVDRQDYPRVEALVVDDGSLNREDLLEILEQFSSDRFRVLLKANTGKRHSQHAVLERARGEIVVTVDSDTLLDRNAISRIVEPFADPEIGAVTGDVRAENLSSNLLTRLIGYRYWTAFHQERAAQSLFAVVMCCSGPFSAYRREVLETVKDEYVTQRFLGETCTFGDDRHLTNLFLAAGTKVRFHARARCSTFVPTTLRQYVKQQVRWNKSFYREMLWTLRFAHRRHIYLGFDLLLQAALPFMLVVALGSVLYQAMASGPAHLANYLVLLVAIALGRAMYGLVRTRDPGFLLFVVYGFIHVLVLMPVRLYALATLKRTGWGTRTA